MGQQNSLDVLSIKIKEEITLKVVQRLTGLPFPSQAQTLSPPRFHWARLQPQSVWKAGLPPWQAQKTEHQRDYSRLKIKWNLPCQVLDLLRSMTPFFFQFFPFRMRMSILSLSHHCILKLAQFHRFIAREEFLPQDKSYLKAHPHIQMIFR